MTIKNRIVIWYTIWMAVLAAIMLSVVLSGSGYILQREARSELEENVQEAAEDIEFYRDGSISLEEVEFFDDGVYIAVFDHDGSFLGGRNREDLSGYPLSVGRITEVDGASGSWFILDEEGPGGVIVRGMMRSSYGVGAYMGSMQLLVIILLPVILLLSALGGYFIVRRSFKPADRAIAAADDIIGSNDLSKRIGLGDGSDEIHRMASAFDGMLERLEAAFAKEKQFTSDASHELRTPISVIMAESEYALEHTDDCERMADALSHIHRQAGKMSALVSELLSLARADKGTLKPSYENFNLYELGEMVLSTMKDRAAEKNISLSMKGERNLMVRADQGMLTRVLINYISNAVQYGNEDGWVLLRIVRKNGWAEISVEDNGKGIRAEDLGRIWDRFYQADASRSSQSSGAGLGLSIVKSIAAAHGGEVGVESVYGEGSTFYFRIPADEK